MVAVGVENIRKWPSHHINKRTGHSAHAVILYVSDNLSQFIPT